MDDKKGRLGDTNPHNSSGRNGHRDGNDGDDEGGSYFSMPLPQRPESIGKIHSHHKYGMEDSSNYNNSNNVSVLGSKDNTIIVPLKGKDDEKVRRPPVMTASFRRVTSSAASVASRESGDIVYNAAEDDSDRSFVLSGDELDLETTDDDSEADSMCSTDEKKKNNPQQHLLDDCFSGVGPRPETPINKRGRPRRRRGKTTNISPKPRSPATIATSSLTSLSTRNGSGSGSGSRRIARMSIKKSLSPPRVRPGDSGNSSVKETPMLVVDIHNLQESSISMLEEVSQFFEQTNGSDKSSTKLIMSPSPRTERRFQKQQMQEASSSSLLNFNANSNVGSGGSNCFRHDVSRSPFQSLTTGSDSLRASGSSPGVSRPATLVRSSTAPAFTSLASLASNPSPNTASHKRINAASAPVPSARRISRDGIVSPVAIRLTPTAITPGALAPPIETKRSHLVKKTSNRSLRDDSGDNVSDDGESSMPSVQAAFSAQSSPKKYTLSNIMGKSPSRQQPQQNRLHSSSPSLGASMHSNAESATGSISDRRNATFDLNSIQQNQREKVQRQQSFQSTASSIPPLEAYSSFSSIPALEAYSGNSSLPIIDRAAGKANTSNSRRVSSTRKTATNLTGKSNSAGVVSGSDSMNSPVSSSRSSVTAPDLVSCSSPSTKSKSSIKVDVSTGDDVALAPSTLARSQTEPNLSTSAGSLSSSNMSRRARQSMASPERVGGAGMKSPTSLYRSMISPNLSSSGTPNTKARRRRHLRKTASNRSMRDLEMDDMNSPSLSRSVTSLNLATSHTHESSSRSRRNRLRSKNSPEETSKKDLESSASLSRSVTSPNLSSSAKSASSRSRRSSTASRKPRSKSPRQIRPKGGLVSVDELISQTSSMKPRTESSLPSSVTSGSSSVSKSRKKNQSSSTQSLKDPLTTQPLDQHGHDSSLSPRGKQDSSSSLQPPPPPIGSPGSSLSLLLSQGLDPIQESPRSRSTRTHSTIASLPGVPKMSLDFNNHVSSSKQHSKIPVDDHQPSSRLHQRGAAHSGQGKDTVLEFSSTITDRDSSSLLSSHRQLSSRSLGLASHRQLSSRSLGHNTASGGGGSVISLSSGDPLVDFLKTLLERDPNNESIASFLGSERGLEDSQTKYTITTKITISAAPQNGESPNEAVTGLGLKEEDHGETDANHHHRRSRNRSTRKSPHRRSKKLYDSSTTRSHHDIAGHEHQAMHRPRSTSSLRDSKPNQKTAHSSATTMNASFGDLDRISHEARRTKRRERRGKSKLGESEKIAPHPDIANNSLQSRRSSGRSLPTLDSFSTVPKSPSSAREKPSSDARFQDGHGGDHSHYNESHNISSLHEERASRYNSHSGENPISVSSNEGKKASSLPNKASSSSTDDVEDDASPRSAMAFDTSFSNLAKAKLFSNADQGHDDQPSSYSQQDQNGGRLSQSSATLGSVMFDAKFCNIEYDSNHKIGSMRSIGSNSIIGHVQGSHRHHSHPHSEPNIQKKSHDPSASRKERPEKPGNPTNPSSTQDSDDKNSDEDSHSPREGLLTSHVVVNDADDSSKKRVISRRFSFESGTSSQQIFAWEDSFYDKVDKADEGFSGETLDVIKIHERLGRRLRDERRGRSRTRKKSSKGSGIKRFFNGRHSLDSRTKENSRSSTGEQRYSKWKKRPRRMSLPSSMPSQNVGHTAKEVVKFLVTPAMRIVDRGRNRSKTPDTRNQTKVFAVPLDGVDYSQDF